MKVHPVPRKRNIALRNDIVSAFSPANTAACRQKKLRRLPHIFAKVLELPFHSDADVSNHETSDSLRFVIPTDDVGDNITAHVVDIYPGVTKIVIRGDDVFDSLLSGLELDLWRFRLPAATVPELASASISEASWWSRCPNGRMTTATVISVELVVLFLYNNPILFLLCLSIFSYVVFKC